MSSEKQMLPGEMLRLYARAGVRMASRITQLQRDMAVLRERDPDFATKLTKRIGKTLLWSNGLPLTREECASVAEAMLDPSAAATPVHRAFAMQLSIMGEYDYSNRGAAIIDLQWATRWASVGLPVFSLTHGLAAALLLTEPADFDATGFELPFPAFAITVPAGLLPFFGDEAGVFGETILVHRFVCPHDGRDSDVLHIDIRSRSRNLWHRYPLSEILEVERSDIAVDPSGYRLVEGDYRTIEVALRLVRNLVAWIEANGRGEPEGRSKHKKGQSSARNEDAPLTWVLGREVKIAPELRRVAAEVALGEGQGDPGWKLRMRFCVRGHWRWQAHGTGRAKRKRIWIAPFWKGPEGAAAWAHVYTVEEKI